MTLPLVPACLLFRGHNTFIRPSVPEVRTSNTWSNMFPNIIQHKVMPRKEKPVLSLTEIQFPFPAFQKIFKKENRSARSKGQKEYCYTEKKKYDLKLSLGLQMCSVFDFMQAAVIEKVLLNAHLPNAQWDQTNGNVKSLEYRKVYCRVVQRQIAHASCPNPKL